MSGSGSRSDGIFNVASRVVVVANPAAGADWSFANTQTGQLVAVTATLVTSATVANRLPALQIKTATPVTLFTLSASAVQAASLTNTYLWEAGGPFTSGNNQSFVPIPSGVVAPVGWTISTLTTALQVGDQWSAIVLTFSG